MSAPERTPTPAPRPVPLPICGRCDGCGRIADSTDGEPWKHWQSLPLGSDLAVRLGVVKPLPCPDCGGTGGAR